MISRYTGISPKGDLTLLGLLGEKLKNKSFLHVNSTKEGGGVAEILHRMVPIMADLGIDVRWETIEGDEFATVAGLVHGLTERLGACEGRHGVARAVEDDRRRHAGPHAMQR